MATPPPTSFLPLPNPKVSNLRLRMDFPWQYKLQRRKWLEKESTGEGKLRKILKEAYSDLKVFKALENPYGHMNLSATVKFHSK